MTNYKKEYVVQQKILGEWKDVESRDSKVAAEVAEEKIHFENQTTGKSYVDTRVVFRQTFWDVSEEVLS